MPATHCIHLENLENSRKEKQEFRQVAMIPLCQHRLCKNAAEEGKVICSECKESELLPCREWVSGCAICRGITRIPRDMSNAAAMDALRPRVTDFGIACGGPACRRKEMILPGSGPGCRDALKC